MSSWQGEGGQLSPGSVSGCLLEGHQHPVINEGMSPTSEHKSRTSGQQEPALAHVKFSLPQGGVCGSQFPDFNAGAVWTWG